jgi:methionyl-tRNA formyltransferase
MKIAIIGRTEILYDVAERLHAGGHELACVLTGTEAKEYTRTADDFRMLALRYNIPFAQGARIQHHYALLQAARADIAVSINYTGVIPQEVIELFPLGILNAHGGDLPRYRGNACQAWAILNGENRIGLCVHKMIGGELDSGEIITRDYLPINHNTKVTQVLEWMVRRTPELIIEAVSRLEHQPDYVLEHQSKVPKDALRCYPRKPEDGRIDWRQSAIYILRLINASNKPYAGAFCDYEGKKLFIWDAELVENHHPFCAVPGQVTMIAESMVEVACGVGLLRLLSVELDGTIAYPSALIKSLRTRLR